MNWISVKDALPDSERPVLVLIPFVYTAHPGPGIPVRWYAEVKVAKRCREWTGDRALTDEWYIDNTTGFSNGSTVSARRVLYWTELNLPEGLNYA